MKRRRFSPSVLAAELERRGNVCSICGKPFVDGERIEWDHTHPLAMGGPDTIDNLRPAHVPCHKGKSGHDARARAKVRRITGKTKRRVGKKIKSAGFDKRWRKKMDGTIVEGKG